MKLYDISIPLSPDVPVFPGDPTVSFTEHSEINKGGVCNLSIYNYGSHSATHMDAPIHFIKDGKSVSDLPLERFMGRALVVDIGSCNAVTAEHVRPLNIEQGMNILFKTGNGDALFNSEFKKDFVYITPEAAQVLVDKQVNLVGIDYLSVEQFGASEFIAHKILLSNEIIILEGIRLTEIEPGEYTLIAFPVLIEKANGSSVRAVLLKE